MSDLDAPVGLHPHGLGDSPVVELRQYTLRPGARDVLIDLFEREFIEAQEAVGIRVGGVYRDRESPDRFVWLRGFTDMEARREALTGFYFGPVWQRHRDVANPTMLDSDDVLLLAPTTPEHWSPGPARGRAAVDDPATPRDRVVISVYEHDADDDLDHWLAAEVHPLLEDVLGVPVGTWRTLAAPNTFPQLPVREDVRAFVWTATFASSAQELAARARLAADPRWSREVQPRLDASVRRTQDLALEPTHRSQHPASRRIDGPAS